MKLNWTTKVLGSKVILVPYRAEHVTKYHDWMKQPDLLELTGSEPLTLDQEYDMQKTWRDDPDKCTFIILDRHKINDDDHVDEISAMVGDTNVFLSHEEDIVKGEIEIMSAGGGCGGGGLGWEAVCSMMRYAVEKLDVSLIEAKIKMGNEASIKMFEQKLNFSIVSKSDLFKEITLNRRVDEQFRTFLVEQTQKYQLEDYVHPDI